MKTMSASRHLRLEEVEALIATDTLIVDVCRNVVRAKIATISLASRPVLFALVRALGEFWPENAPRQDLLIRAFRARDTDESHRVRLQVEIWRLCEAVRSLAAIDATERGFVLERREVDVVNSCRDSPTGTLRLNVPVIVARLVMPPIMLSFLKFCSGITIEIDAENAFIDVVAAGYDADIRYDERLEQNMIAVPIGRRVQRYAMATSPADLDARGRPGIPAI